MNTPERRGYTVHSVMLPDTGSYSWGATHAWRFSFNVGLDHAGGGHIPGRRLCDGRVSGSPLVVAFDHQRPRADIVLWLRELADELERGFEDAAIEEAEARAYAYGQ